MVTSCHEDDCITLALLMSGLQSRQLFCDFDSDSVFGLKISAPTLTPTPLRLRPTRGISSWKEQYDAVIFLISLLIQSKCRRCSTRLRKLWMRPAEVIANSFERVQYGSIWIWWQSHNDRDGPIIYPIHYIWRSYVTEWCFNVISALPLSFSKCVSCFWDDA